MQKENKHIGCTITTEIDKNPLRVIIPQFRLLNITTQSNIPLLPSTPPRQQSITTKTHTQPQPTVTFQSRHHPNASFELLKADLLRVYLPNLRCNVFATADRIQFSKISEGTRGVFEISVSVLVHANLTWEVLVNGKKSSTTMEAP